MIKCWSLGYEKAKKKAKGIYSKIGQIPCPALNDDVYFNSKGFRHLVRKGRIPRPRNEQKRRFVLLKYAEKIIKNPKAKIFFRQEERKIKIDRHGEKLLTTKMVNFWTFVEEIEDCKVKVVIGQFGQRAQKNFVSIMGDNVKIK